MLLLILFSLSFETRCCIIVSPIDTTSGHISFQNPCISRITLHSCCQLRACCRERPCCRVVITSDSRPHPQPFTRPWCATHTRAVVSTHSVRALIHSLSLYLAPCSITGIRKDAALKLPKLCRKAWVLLRSTSRSARHFTSAHSCIMSPHSHILCAQINIFE